MHLTMILIALGLAWWHRCRWSYSQGSWTQRWQRSLSVFLFPPLLLTITALAVLYMGPEEEPVFWQWQGRFSYLLASGLCGLAGVLCLKLASESWRSLQQVRTCPQLNFMGKNSRILDNPIPFSALIGFWQPELLVSQGLLHTLDSAHLQAVFKHEQGHYYYRDTFWFFWLSWVRSYTAWLPNTEALWQELLLLRELRADRWAAQQVDPLLLAEALLVVVSTLPVSDNCCAAFSCAAPRSRLTERIEALLASELNSHQPSLWSWTWLLLAFLPLAAVPFHNCSHLSISH